MKVAREEIRLSEGTDSRFNGTPGLRLREWFPWALTAFAGPVATVSLLTQKCLGFARSGTRGEGS